MAHESNDNSTGSTVSSAQCGWLTTVVAAVWLLMSVPAYGMAGFAGLEGLSYAAILCLLPGWLVFWLVSRYGVAKTQAGFVLLATGLRLGSVLLGMFAVQQARPHLGFREFILWLLLFYMVTLFAETVLLLKKPSA